ncbi:MAG: isoaspartyl peptidase/L-asparaginase [Acidobacteria bacterium]|nr:isoaspartyl peptidase/L-asparaginase [Acidobacteriota bacterium]MBK9529444.1 isoaspartyl peptidase/L-asparaginase [Acidobacteriota bacterium]MBP7476595.1 isoaspartyl peptidase/L-asparaginase [Pyrinomonadaceae bacterium]MBP9110639.1 isoaspartyl peptidase/L-asparaginase [Pyrinomonadaceae bacterium]
MAKMALAIHGGAGTILRSQMTPDLEREYRGGLETALKAGWAILESGGSSLDAVERAVISLEDFPLFNAGRGSVFTHAGEQEMDAAIMDGNNLRAGAVAFVKNIKNPVGLARLVMERTEHVLLAGEGANQFAEQIGVKAEPDEYFFTEHRWLQLQEAIAEGRVQLDHANSPPYEGGVAAASADGVVLSDAPPRKPIGTVGAVACDKNGHLAAATSTGGMTNKKFGRIGDTAIIGSGTYADQTCAVSCTGHGEYFMLAATAFDVAARMKYKSLSLEAAAQEAVDYLTTINGEGGLIAVDTSGKVTLPFNSDGMYRGSIAPGGAIEIEIYKTQ